MNIGGARRGVDSSGCTTGVGGTAAFAPAAAPRGAGAINVRALPHRYGWVGHNSAQQCASPGAEVRQTAVEQVEARLLQLRGGRRDAVRAAARAAASATQSRAVTAVSSAAAAIAIVRIAALRLREC